MIIRIGHITGEAAVHLASVDSIKSQKLIKAPGAAPGWVCGGSRGGEYWCVALARKGIYHQQRLPDELRSQVLIRTVTWPEHDEA